MRLDTEIRRIETSWGSMKLIVLRPRGAEGGLPGILWIHGGGYYEGRAEMVFLSKGRDAAMEYGAVVVSPEYRLSGEAPYPAALDDCWAALLWLRDHREELGVDLIMVGGESAGGGLAAAVCMRARDSREVDIAFQMPLYPMLDCDDTESSADNNTPIFWNTKRNHEAWKQYLGPLWGSENVPPYASPAKQTDYSGLPPCYTFVADGEPFYAETLRYVENLNRAGVPAKADVFHAEMHAFDALFPWRKASKDAKAAFLLNFGEALSAIRNNNDPTGETK
ncbi:MAG: alpha/beta hydrolase [Clostridia bacterium]|nr:alpha/beta hydrolase [Clostridia bacterium]